MPEKLVLMLDVLDETKRIGRKIGGLLRAGDVVLLNGDLGAGKTTIAKAISRGLGVKSDRYVVSPSYAIINEYDGNFKIYHFDLYRIENFEDIYGLGAYEYFNSSGVCLVEWGEKFPEAMPDNRLELFLEHTGKSSRKMTMTAIGARYEKIIRELRK